MSVSVDLSKIPLTGADDFNLYFAVENVFRANLLEILYRYSIREITIADLYQYLELPAIALTPFLGIALKSMYQSSGADMDADDSGKLFEPFQASPDLRYDLYNFLVILKHAADSDTTTYFLGDSLTVFKDIYQMYLCRKELNLELAKSLPYSGNMFGDSADPDITMAKATKSAQYLAKYSDLLANNVTFAEVKAKLVAGTNVILADYINYGKGVKTLLYMLHNDPEVKPHLGHLKLLLWITENLDDVPLSHSAHVSAFTSKLLDFMAAADPKPEITYLIIKEANVSQLTNSEVYLQRCVPKYGITSWDKRAPEKIYHHDDATLYFNCNITKYLVFLQSYAIIENMVEGPDPIPASSVATTVSAKIKYLDADHPSAEVNIKLTPIIDKVRFCGFVVKAESGIHDHAANTLAGQQFRLIMVLLNKIATVRAVAC